MDQYQDINPTGRSPRRELQGPRPTPLRIHKDSHKIKKPPLAPPPQQQPSQHPPPPRQPIIIYTVSPKIIHTTPNDFMNLVQRLTGSSSSSSSSSTTTFPSSSSTSNDPFNNGDGMNMVSPAARYATVEKAMSPMGIKKQAMVVPTSGVGDVSGVEGVVDTLMNNIHGGGGVGISNNMFQGILSPGPASLSPIPPNFFTSPPPSSSDPSMVSFLHDLSPMLHSSRNFMEGSSFILPSPSNFVSPHTPSIDLFNYFLD